MSQKKKFIIEDYNPNGKCLYSGKVGETFEISTNDGSIQNAEVSFNELKRLVRFDFRQRDRNGISKHEETSSRETVAVPVDHDATSE